jgi:Lipase (class 3)
MEITNFQPFVPRRVLEASDFAAWLSQPSEPEVPPVDPVLWEDLDFAAAISRFVYEPLTHVEAVLKEQGMTEVMSIRSVGIGEQGREQGVCFIRGKQGWIVFRGSDESVDWLLNLCFLPIPWPMQHLGFALAWLRVRGQVKEWMDKVVEKQLQGFEGFTLAGHSLGGALAQRAAFGIAKQYPIAGVITYGAPRFALGRMAAQYEDRKLQDVTFGYINYRDLVTKVPPRWLGFRRVGQTIFIDGKGQIHSGDAAEKAERSSRIQDMIVAFTMAVNDSIPGVGTSIPPQGGLAHVGGRTIGLGIDSSAQVWRPPDPNEARIGLTWTAIRNSFGPSYGPFLLPLFVYFWFWFDLVRSLFDHDMKLYAGSVSNLEFRAGPNSGLRKFRSWLPKVVLGFILTGVALLGFYLLLRAAQYFGTPHQ